MSTVTIVIVYTHQWQLKIVIFHLIVLTYNIWGVGGSRRKRLIG